MRTAALLGACGLLLLGLATDSLAGLGEPVNLLTNGGFEDGLTGWNADAQQTLVTEPGKAHSGKACLTGEVTSPNKALILRRQVAVQAGNRYEFEIWVRATNRTKLVLWAVLPGAVQRQSIATWEQLTPRWQRCRTAISVVSDGMLELQIIAPSSHKAPPGQIWIDDVAFYETSMPPLVSVSQDLGFNDEPAMARASDGSLYVAWNSFRDEADSLQVARYVRNEKGLEPTGRWQLCGGKGTYLLSPRVVPAGKDVALVYAAETDKNWEVHAVSCGPEGPGEPIVVGAHTAVDVDPAACWRDGTLWLTWESNRNGFRQVFVTSVADGKASEPVALSTCGSSSYDPSVTVLANGEVCVAWHAFRDNNYDLFLRRRTVEGVWRPEVRLTRAPTIDRHAELFCHGNDLWLVYENAQIKTYHIGATNRRRLVVAKVTSEGLQTPRLQQAKSPLDERCEGATAAFDADGRLWLAFLKPRLPRAGWDAFLIGLAGDGWTKPLPVSTLKGMDRRPMLALESQHAVVCFQADDLPNSWNDVDRSMVATSNIYLADFDLADAPPPAAIVFEPLVESDEPFEPAEIRVARGEDLPTPTINHQGQKLKLFFGDLHEHTDVSVCNRLGDQSIDESYQHMRDIAVYDFASTTDHGYNLNPYLWYYTAKMVRVNHDPDRFLTFLAEEWTSTFEEYDAKHPYGFYGHRNLILADPYFPKWWNARDRKTPTQVWEELRKMNANFVHIPHQLADTGNVPTDWSFLDEQAQPVAEIFQTRGSYEYKGAPREAPRTISEPGSFLQDAWARGIVMGVIASPDHGGGYGKACVVAPELTREAILDALRARHCYGTTGAKIVLDVRVAGHLMGDKVAEPAGSSVPIEIRVRCPGDIECVEVCRNNQFIHKECPAGGECELTFVDRQPLEGRSYYYVRVMQKDGEIAWSSPVWFGVK